MSKLISTLKWSAVEGQYAALDLIRGTGDFRLTFRDGKVLTLLFDRHFLQARHISYWAGFPKLDKFHRRILKLYEHGLIARAKIKPPFRVVSEYAYALTRLGLQVIAHGLTGEDDETELVEEARQTLTDGWTPPYIWQGARNAPFHELAVADFSLALTELFRLNEQSVLSSGSRALTEHYTLPGRGPYVYSVSPDAAVWAGASGREMLLEVQRSVTPKKIAGLLRKYKNYFTARGRRDAFFTEPLVLISIDDIHNEQRYWNQPYEETLRIAKEEFFERAIFIPESRWREDEWVVNKSDGSSADLLDYFVRL